MQSPRTTSLLPGGIFSVTLHKCNHGRINKEEDIRYFFSEKIISCCSQHVHLFGDPLIIYLGTSKDDYGYTVIQLCKEGFITCRFVTHTREGHIIFFSTKNICAKKIASRCRKYFNAEEYTFTTQPRQYNHSNMPLST